MPSIACGRLISPRSLAGLPANCRVHTFEPMTIVTTRRPKRPAKPAQAAKIAVPRIVQHTPRGKAWKLPALEPDPEADARIAAFLARMVRPRSS
jgi:hypothetical protein